MTSCPASADHRKLIRDIVRQEFEQLFPEAVLDCLLSIRAGISAESADGPKTSDLSQVCSQSLGQVEAEPTLPTASQLRNEIKRRKGRTKFVAPDLLGEPVWDILLELALADVEGKQISISSLCIASGVPNTTALRWVNLLCYRGLCARQGDDDDRRRKYISLSSQGRSSLIEYFANFPL